MSRDLFNDKKSIKQIAIFRKYRNFSADEANRVGLARWQSQKNGGVWEHENFLDNFGTGTRECLNEE